MHYFQFNIKSYHTDTVHLSNEEDLCYRRLLDMYYDTESPIPNANPTLTRRLRVGLKELESVLNEFFELTDLGWVNQHCEQVIAEYHAFIDKQRANGSKGGRRNKPTANPPLTDGNPNANPTINNKPLTTNHKDQILLSSPKVSDPIPYQEIVNIYHEKLPMCPRVKLLTSKRKGQIAARWKSGVLPSLETWGKYFLFCSESKWLTGKVDPSAGRKRFVADIEWLTNETNLTKVWERKYHE